MYFHFQSYFLVDQICPDPEGALTMCFMISACIKDVDVPVTFAFTANKEVLACLALTAGTLGISKAAG